MVIAMMTAVLLAEGAREAVAVRRSCLAFFLIVSGTTGEAPTRTHEDELVFVIFPSNSCMNLGSFAAQSSSTEK